MSRAARERPASQQTRGPGCALALWADSPAPHGGPRSLGAHPQDEVVTVSGQNVGVPHQEHLWGRVQGLTAGDRHRHGAGGVDGRQARAPHSRRWTRGSQGRRRSPGSRTSGGRRGTGRSAGAETGTRAAAGAGGGGHTHAQKRGPAGRGHWGPDSARTPDSGVRLSLTLPPTPPYPPAGSHLTRRDASAHTKMLIVAFHTPRARSKPPDATDAVQRP